jgi:hypothetical protein
MENRGETMKQPEKDLAGTEDAAPPAVAMGLGWSAALEQRPRGAALRIQHPEQGVMTVEITITARGPVIRTTAAALEIEAADEIVARCERFTVEARETVSLRGRSVEVEATGGDVRLRANDDVQVLGEQVLLNCEREEPLPSWLPQAPVPQIEVTVPRQDAGGDQGLFETPPR